jgi:hypothetical protein
MAVARLNTTACVVLKQPNKQELAKLKTQDAQVINRRGVVPPVADGEFKEPLRLGRATFAGVDDAELIGRFGVVGPELQQSLKQPPAPDGSFSSAAGSVASWNDPLVSTGQGR